MPVVMSFVIFIVRTSGLQGSDLPVLALVVAPYLLLGLMVGWARQRSADSRFLFLATLLLSLGGTALLGLNAIHQQTMPEPGLALSITYIGVPLLQLVAVAVLGMILLMRRTMA